MKEVKPPKRPLIFYYCVAILVLLLFNFLAMPWMAQRQIQEVDYNTFVEMLDEQQVGLVQPQQIHTPIFAHGVSAAWAMGSCGGSPARASPPRRPVPRPPAPGAGGG